jgi:hypothetical protein
MKTSDTEDFVKIKHALYISKDVRTQRILAKAYIAYGYLKILNVGKCLLFIYLQCMQEDNTRFYAYDMAIYAEACHHSYIILFWDAIIPRLKLG